MRQVNFREQIENFFKLHDASDCVMMIKHKQSLDDILGLLHAGGRLNFGRSWVNLCSNKRIGGLQIAVCNSSLG